MSDLPINFVEVYYCLCNGNGKYEAVDRKSSRLVYQEVSDLWRATTPDAVNISDSFSQREFTAALQHLKPGKASGRDPTAQSLYSMPELL